MILSPYHRPKKFNTEIQQIFLPKKKVYAMFSEIFKKSHPHITQ